MAKYGAPFKMKGGSSPMKRLFGYTPFKQRKKIHRELKSILGYLATSTGKTVKKVIEKKLNIASGEPTPQKRRKIYRKIYKDTQDELKKN